MAHGYSAYPRFFLFFIIVLRTASSTVSIAKTTPDTITRISESVIKQIKNERNAASVSEKSFIIPEKYRIAGPTSSISDAPPKAQPVYTTGESFFLKLRNTTASAANAINAKPAVASGIIDAIFTK